MTTQGLKTLQDLMRETLPPTGRMVKGAGAYMEVIDPGTQEVWMCSSATGREQFETWAPEAPFQKTGIGKGAMNCAAFRHAPSGQAVALQVKEIGGRECYQVAKPADLASPDEPGMPLRITVIKAHTLGFESGRTISIMSIHGENFIEVVGDDAFDIEIKAPTGGSFRQIELKNPWIVELPYPTTTYFWRTSGGARSFQGPISLPNE